MTSDFTERVIEITAITVGLAVIALRLFMTDRRRLNRTLHRIALTRIGDARDGRLIKIMGTLEYADSNLTGPLSGRSCAYYSVSVEEQAGRTGWSEILREEKGMPFRVRDETGTARVLPSEPPTTLAAVGHYKTARISRIFFSDVNLEGFLSSRGISVDGLLVSKNLRAFEGILEAGEQVTVAGIGRLATQFNVQERLTLAPSGAMALFLRADPSA
jgi:hypothetical protein